MKGELIVVVSQTADLPEMEGRTVLADDYLSSSGGAYGDAVVVNLCRSYRYRSKGYYISLVADARAHRVFPTVETLEELREPFGMYRVLREAGIPTLEVSEIKSWKPSRSPGENEAEAVVFFGETSDKRFRKAASAAYRAWPMPVMRIAMVRRAEQWWVASAEPVPLQRLDIEQRRLFADVLRNARIPAVRSSSHVETKRASIAVLYDPADPFTPSTPDTLAHLERVASQLNIYVDRIGLDEIDRLPEFDALFIRALTGVREPAFQFALRAEMLDMPVIDDPQSIIRCSNKVFLEELLGRQEIPTPRTMILTARTPWSEVSTLGAPLVVKLPDGSFSTEVYKVANEKQYQEIAGEIFRRSPLLIAQEFLRTEFDWRVTVLDGQILFVARYFMADGHWQIRSKETETEHYGRVEAVPRNSAPREVVDLAKRAAALIGRGLYGVDIKMTEAGPVVIEINDNPNLDRGEEDVADGDLIYRDILQYFLRQIETPAKPKSSPSRITRRNRKEPRAFSVAGLELEYPIVNADLDPASIVEPALRILAGRGTSDFQMGSVGLSNEIADHVVEFKMVEPVASLADAEQPLVDGIRRFSEMIRLEFGARLLPTGMHPWFDPARGRIWSRSGRRTYRSYASIFDIQTHGWMNVHATHLNLPMGSDSEAVALHNAAAIVIPFLPAIAASSPLFDGALQPSMDSRLEWILKHQATVPESQGEFIPEPISSIAQYRRDVLQPMYQAIGYFPEGGNLKHDFLNARGAVFKFGRKALEVRAIDTQECVKADVAIAVFTRALLRHYAKLLMAGRLHLPDSRVLQSDFRASVRDGSRARIHAPLLTEVARDADGKALARDCLRILLQAVTPNIRRGEEVYLPLLERMIEIGSLAERIHDSLSASDHPSPTLRARIRSVYEELSLCLESNELWNPERTGRLRSL